MHPETPYRLAVLVVFALSISVTAYYRWQAARSGESISRQDEGYLFAFVLRLAGITLWLATLGYLIVPERLSWASLPLPSIVRWCGLVVGLGCALLMRWTLSSLGKNLTDTVVTRQAATLVTTGPYRWVRHPFYMTAALLMSSVTVLAANWFLGLMSLIVLVLLAVRTPQEEAKLLERFGDDYRAYMTRTGRFWPKLFR